MDVEVDVNVNVDMDEVNVTVNVRMWMCFLFASKCLSRVKSFRGNYDSINSTQLALYDAHKTQLDATQQLMARRHMQCICGKAGKTPGKAGDQSVNENMTPGRTFMMR